MNREEALEIINGIERHLANQGMTEEEYSLDEALVTLGVYKQPDPITILDTDINVARKDPITGLVPCGCGGVTEQTDFHDGFFPHSKVECLECGIEMMRAGYTILEAHDKVKRDWNRAMGHKGGAE